MVDYKLKKEHRDFFLAKFSLNKTKNSISLIKKNEKNIQNFFADLHFNENEWPYETSDLDILVSKKILFKDEKEGKYLLTYKGLVIVDYNIIQFDDCDQFLNDLNSNFFEKTFKIKDDPLKEQNIVILFTVLGSLAFSSDYSLEIDESNKTIFFKTAQIAIEILQKYYPQNATEFEKIWDSKIVGEDPILQIMRRLDELPKKTGNIFKSPSRNKHGVYVDILNEDGSINSLKVIFLIKKIFKREIFDFAQKQEIIKCLNELEKSSFMLIKSNKTINKIAIKTQLRDIIQTEL